jgi:hypothetical protein
LAERLQACLELHLGLVRLVLSRRRLRELGIDIRLIREPGCDLSLMILRRLFRALQLIARRRQLDRRILGRSRLLGPLHGVFRDRQLLERDRARGTRCECGEERGAGTAAN